MKGPLVSVIIPTKDSSRTLTLCLDSIVNQTYKNIEIIVVDNYSDDCTVHIAKRYTNKVVTIGPERSAQVNYGARVASGKYIYRVDSDFVLDRDVIKEAVAVAELNNYAAILIHNTSDPTVSFWSKVRKFERDMYVSDDLRVAVRFIQKDIFLSIGGFDTELIAGEDYDLHRRVVEKYDIGRIDAREIHLGEYKSIKEVAEKNFLYGKSIGLFFKKNKGRGIKQFSPFRRTYLSHYKDFILHPSLTCGFVIYQAVRYSSAVAGMLLQKLLH